MAAGCFQSRLDPGLKIRVRLITLSGCLKITSLTPVAVATAFLEHIVAMTPSSQEWLSPTL